MVGQRIKELRLEKNITQTQLAQQLNVSQDTISLWERNISSPTIEYLIHLCRFFGVSADYLLGIIDDEY